jgi:UDP-N-acetylglucosamine transferase subunit ALG13
MIEERLRSDDRGFDGVVSTGAALALSAFSAGTARALPRLYIESVSRTHGPSLTGRLVRQLRLARLRTQHRSWAGGPWAYDGSVLDEYETVPAPVDAPRSPRVFVTLGTIRPYRFDALVDAVRGTGLAGPDAVWQLGQTARGDLPGRAFAQTSAAEFDGFCDDADVVVTHAGVGTVMQLLDRGICPVVVPRRHRRGEHVDDHQAQICELLTARGLGVVVEADELTAEHLRAAAGRRTLGIAERVAQ